MSLNPCDETRALINAVPVGRNDTLASALEKHKDGKDALLTTDELVALARFKVELDEW